MIATESMEPAAMRRSISGLTGRRLRSTCSHRDFFLQIFEFRLDRWDLVITQCLNEGASGETGDFGSLCLGKPPQLIPFHARGQPEFRRKLGGGGTKL